MFKRVVLLLLISASVVAAPWGKTTSVDLYGCNPKTIRDHEQLSAYVIALCDLIKVNRYGSVQKVRFGQGRVRGYSIVQLIETSLVSGHFAEESNAAYIDVFSCSDYDSQVVADFTKMFFQAARIDVHIYVRN